MVDDRRVQPPAVAGDRATLTGLLQYQRETLGWKCDGLTAEQRKQRAVPPSALSLRRLMPTGPADKSR